MPKRQRTEEPPRKAEDDELSLDSEEETAVAVASGLVSRTRKEAAITNIDGIKQALHELVDPDLPWVERLEVVAAEDLPPIAPDDDLKLELAL